MASELPEKRSLNEFFSPNSFADEVGLPLPLLCSFFFEIIDIRHKAHSSSKVSGYPAYIFNQCIKNRIETADRLQRANLEAIFFPPHVDTPSELQKLRQGLNPPLQRTPSSPLNSSKGARASEESEEMDPEVILEHL